jgi:hypothetical protein
VNIRLEWLVSFKIGYSENWIKLHAAHPPYLFITGEMKNVLNPIIVFNCHSIFFCFTGFRVAADIFVFEPDRFGFDEWFVELALKNTRTTDDKLISCTVIFKL